MSRVLDNNMLEIIAKEVGFQNVDRYRSRCDFLFDGIDLEGSRVLDVGCGKGALALWAAVNGAGKVLGIEPEAEGSSSGMFGTFEYLVERLNLRDVVKTRSCFLHDLTPAEGIFDVAVLFNVINHIDENAVVGVHKDKKAADAFVASLVKLKELVAPGGQVVVADCGRRNFWNDLGLTNPLMPTIEWDKHQQPGVWTDIFARAGFELVDLKWSQIHPFGKISCNALLHYFTLSHFTMRFRRPK